MTATLESISSCKFSAVSEALRSANIFLGLPQLEGEKIIIPNSKKEKKRKILPIRIIRLQNFKIRYRWHNRLVLFAEPSPTLGEDGGYNYNIHSYLIFTFCVIASCKISSEA